MGHDGPDVCARCRGGLTEGHAGRSRRIPKENTAGLFHGRQNSTLADEILSDECLQGRLVDDMEQDDLFRFSAREGFERLNSPL